MSQIHDLPANPPSTAGLDFDYSVWTPGTVAQFVNVPWNADYRDVPVFENGKWGLQDFIDSQASTQIRIADMSYARPGHPIRVAVPLGKMMNYNYVRVYNPTQPVPGDEYQNWYYFITDVRHVAPNTTEIHVQLDVMQSFLDRVTIGRSYVEAGHIGIANRDQFVDDGRRFLTTPEGFDLGGEYQIDRRFSVADATAVNKSESEKEKDQYPGHQILIASTVDLDSSGGTVVNPELKTARGSKPQGLPSGASMYVFSGGEHGDGADAFTAWLFEKRDQPWVTQGIIGAWAFPGTFEIPARNPIWRQESSPERTLTPVAGDTLDDMIKVRDTPGMEEWRDAEWAIRNPRYRHLKKFLTYPYSFWELTTYTGQPVVLKPESWKSYNGTIVGFACFVSPGLRVTYYPRGYNRGNQYEQESPVEYGLPVTGEFLDMATSITNFPSFPVVNNGAMAYLAQNANSIAFQHQSADWSQQRALAGNEVAYGQASQAMNLQRQQTDLSVATANAQTTVQNQAQGLSTGVNAVGGIVSGAARGGGPGALAGVGSGLMSGANAIIDINARNQSLAISNNAARRSTDLNVNNAAYMRDTNKQYADYAAKGDYRNAIASINAKVQDAAMIQPTVSGQLGGDANLLANYKWGYDLKYKTLTDNAMTMIGEHWLRYGYAINRYYSPGRALTGLHVMSKFTYWKMLECVVIAGSMPETFKQTIRGIFEKGVTVWRDPNDIGVVDPGDNEPDEYVVLK